jgi:hypothetical protein
MSKFARAIPAIAALAAVAAAAPAFATENGTSVTATASLNISSPLTVSKNSDLVFGTVTRPSSGNGQVVIDAQNGNRNVTGNATAVTGGDNPTPTRALFTVYGEANRNITVTVPSNMTMTRQGGSETIPVTLNSSMGGGQVGSNGSATFGVGGQLTLSSSTVPGGYSGTFQVTVAYN